MWSHLSALSPLFRKQRCSLPGVFKISWLWHLSSWSVLFLGCFCFCWFCVELTELLFHRSGGSVRCSFSACRSGSSGIPLQCPLDDLMSYTSPWLCVLFSLCLSVFRLNIFYWSFFMFANPLFCSLKSAVQPIQWLLKFFHVLFWNFCVVFCMVFIFLLSFSMSPITISIFWFKFLYVFVMVVLKSPPGSPRVCVYWLLSSFITGHAVLLCHSLVIIDCMLDIVNGHHRNLVTAH